MPSAAPFSQEAKTMTHAFRATAALAAALAVAGPAPALAKQAGDSPLPPGADDPITTTNSLIIDQQRQDRLPPAQVPVSPPVTLPGPSVAAQAAPAPGVALGRVRVVGSSVPARLEEAWKPFTGRRLDAPTIQAVAQAISAAYAEGDIAFYTIEVPNQDFAGGVLTVRVTEGHLTQVAIDGQTKSKSARLVRRYAARMTAEKPLKRSSMERYMSLIREIPGLTVEARLLQAKTPGGVILSLDLKQQRVRSEVVISNRGSIRLGRTQVQAGLMLSGVATPGDQLRLSFGAPTEFDPFQYYGLGYTTRIGDDGLTLTTSLAHLVTRPTDSPISGEATSAGLTLSYPLKRGYRENVYVSLGLDGQNSDNAAFGRSIFSDHTRALRGSASWSKASAKRVAAANATASFGLDVLDAEADERLTDIDFIKLNSQVGLDQALGQEWVVRLKGVVQASDGRLPGSEQFSLGGDQFGRAFPSAHVIGDYGGAASAEVGWRPKALIPRRLKGSEVYGFTDYGVATSRSRLFDLLPERTRDLSSVGVGVRANFVDKVVVGLEAAKAVDSPYEEGDPWRLLVNWRSRF